MTNNNTSAEKPIKEKKKKGRGCLIALLVLVVIIGVGAIIVFRVPQKIGLVKSPAEKMYTQPNDPEKAAIVMQGLRDSGLNTRGVEVYVAPVAGTDHNTAFIVLDASQGFTFSNTNTADPVDDFINIAVKANQQGINRVAVVYCDEEGKSFATVTAATQDMAAYAQGKITDEQLMERVEIGANNVIGLVNELKSQFK